MGRNYIKEFIWMWIKVIVVYYIAGNLVGAIMGSGFDKQMGGMLALVVFGVTFFNKVITFNLFGNSDAVIIFWLLKLLISFAVGIIAFPIVNIYYIINIIIQIVRFFSARKYVEEEYVDEEYVDIDE